MTVEMTAERLTERGRAYLEWARAGGDLGRLVGLDYDVRVLARVTDWPGREPGPEVRNGIPDVDLPDGDRDKGIPRARTEEPPT